MEKSGERGLRRHGPFKSPEVSLNPGDGIGRAFGAVASGCLTHLHNNREGMLEGDEIEYLHQMRVALRRLRSAIGLFSAVLPALRDRKVLAEVRWLAAELGKARDWDVFMDETLPTVRIREITGYMEFMKKAVDARNEAYSGACAAVRSPRYPKMTDHLEKWIGRFSLPGKPEKAASRPVGKVAAGLLEKRYKRLLKAGERISRLSPEKLHELRIAAKKMRYASEFLAPLFPGKKNAAFVKALAGLQGDLGRLNDISTAFALLRRLRGGGEMEEAVNEATGRLSLRSGDIHAALGPKWKKFNNRKKFW